MHDKDCERTMDIPLDEFEGQEYIKSDMKFCPKCKIKLFSRAACYPDVKETSTIASFLKKHNISNTSLNKYMLDSKIKIKANSAREILVKCNQDNWKITEDENDRLHLFHNNYSIINGTDRIIHDDFHNQNITGNNINYIFSYISSYSWEKHLEVISSDENVQDSISVIESIEKVQETSNDFFIRRYILKFKKWLYSIIKYKRG